MDPRSSTPRRIVALLVAGLLAAGAVASADPPPIDDPTNILLRADHVLATGVGPVDFSMTWQDNALVETHFEIQFTEDSPSITNRTWTTYPIKPNAGGTLGTSVNTFPKFNLNNLQIPVADPDLYYFRVRAVVDELGQNLVVGAWSPEDYAIAGPLAPDSVTATNLSPGSAKITWTNPAAAAMDPWFIGTDVYRQLPGGGLIRIATWGPGVTSMVDPTVPPNTLVSYRLFAVRERAVGGFIERSTSASKLATVTSLPLPLPAKPTNLVATLTHLGPTQDQVDLTWTDNAIDESGYMIHFASDPTFTRETQSILIPVPDLTSYTQLVPPDTKRWYRVQAYRNADGALSAFSNVVSIGSIPGAPTNLVATKVTNSEVDLAWKDNSTTEDGFHVQWCNGVCNSNSTWTNLIPDAGIDDQAYADNTVTQLITRSYRVIAFNGSGSSAPSNIIFVTTPQAPIAKPTGLTAVGIDSRHIKLNWLDNSPDEDGFRIEYSADGIKNWQVLNTVGAGITTYTDGFSLNPNQQRCYRVRAFQVSDGSSDPSNKACAVTMPPQIPGTPSNLQGVALDSRRIKLTWNDTATNELGFKVERTNDGQNWLLVATIYTVDLTTYTDTGLFPSRPYTYRVRAFNNDGDSPPSNTVTVTTDGPPPPIWIHPGHDNEVSASSCTVDGRASVADGVTGVLVYIINTKDGTTQFAGEAAVVQSGPNTGAWSLDVTNVITVAGTYHLAAYAHVGPTSAIYSGAAKIFGWIVPADSLIC